MSRVSIFGSKSVPALEEDRATPKGTEGCWSLSRSRWHLFSSSGRDSWPWSLAHLLSTAPGLRMDHLLTMKLTLSRSQYPSDARQNAFFDQLLERVNSLPGILAVGEISDTPLKGNNPTFKFAVEGMARRTFDAPIQARMRVISTGYLRTAGIPVLEGRDFSVDDRTGGMPVGVINQTMARQYRPGSDALGGRVCFQEDQRCMSVVGVVADIKHMGLKADEGPVVYIPYAQKA
jgi:hypothetical protein